MYTAPQGTAGADVTGYKGFFYHFLDMQTGHRFETVELSTIDTSLLLGGVLFCQSYFTGTDATESAIRAYADSLYLRVDWQWARAQRARSSAWAGIRRAATSMPTGSGYDEGMIVYVLALGSPTHPIDPRRGRRGRSTYEWAAIYGQPFVNSRRCSATSTRTSGSISAASRTRTCAARESTTSRTRAARRSRSARTRSPIRGSGGTTAPNVWGLTASDGPHDTTRRHRRRSARVPHIHGARRGRRRHDATTARSRRRPPADRFRSRRRSRFPALVAMREKYGDNLFTQLRLRRFVQSDVRSYRSRRITARIVPGVGWFDTDYLGIDQGPIIAMIENYRSDLIWKTMRKNPYIVAGLKKAGFTGGWLGN